MNISREIEKAVEQVFRDIGLVGPAMIKQAAKPEFGHYQVNGVMGAAKKSGRNPRELAAEIINQLELGAADTLEVAGPGFINIHLSSRYLASALKLMCESDRLAVDQMSEQKILVDYSSPNLAKEMHVGHLRPTTIGDCLVRMLEFLGHEVIRANHVGDWGAQFGSLLAYMDQLSEADATRRLEMELRDLEKFYQAASRLFKTDEVFAVKAREYVVRLQSGDEKCLKLWKQFIDESITHCQAVYDAFNVSLTREDVKPESFYNDDLPLMVQDLTDQGLAVESEGATCVFLDEFIGKDDKPLPAMIKKSDGGYPYLATDLSAVRYRAGTLKVDKAYYVVGAEQQLHLRQLFAVSHAAGYINPEQTFQHFPHGKVLKKDGTPFKTRDGADVKLADVIQEAKDRALSLVSEKNPELDETVRKEVADKVGTGALKFAELSKNRMTDYIFDWDTMLSFEGNTAPYLQYAYTRIRSIFRKEAIDPKAIRSGIKLNEPREIALGVKLLQFQECLETAVVDCHPNLLCNYLYELAGLFMVFYEHCPVLKAETETRNSRLMLCDLVARTIKQGLGLLGIETVEQM